ncbi:MAG: hypothetical protein ACRC9L_08620 [Brevinema sp.]
MKRNLLILSLLTVFAGCQAINRLSVLSIDPSFGDTDEESNIVSREVVDLSTKDAIPADFTPIITSFGAVGDVRLFSDGEFGDYTLLNSEQNKGIVWSDTSSVEYKTFYPYFFSRLQETVRPFADLSSPSREKITGKVGNNGKTITLKFLNGEATFYLKNIHRRSQGRSVYYLEEFDPETSLSGPLSIVSIDNEQNLDDIYSFFPELNNIPASVKRNIKTSALRFRATINNSTYHFTLFDSADGRTGTPSPTPEGAVNLSSKEKIPFDFERQITGFGSGSQIRFFSEDRSDYTTLVQYYNWGMSWSDADTRYKDFYDEIQPAVQPFLDLSSSSRDALRASVSSDKKTVTIRLLNGEATFYVKEIRGGTVLGGRVMDGVYYLEQIDPTTLKRGTLSIVTVNIESGTSAIYSTFPSLNSLPQRTKEKLKNVAVRIAPYNNGNIRPFVLFDNSATADPSAKPPVYVNLSTLQTIPASFIQQAAASTNVFVIMVNPRDRNSSRWILVYTQGSSPDWRGASGNFEHFFSRLQKNVRPFADTRSGPLNLLSASTMRDSKLINVKFLHGDKTFYLKQTGTYQSKPIHYLREVDPNTAQQGSLAIITMDVFDNDGIQPLYSTFPEFNNLSQESKDNLNESVLRFSVRGADWSAFIIVDTE